MHPTHQCFFIWSVRSTGTRLSRKGQILKEKDILKSILFHEFLIHIKQRLDLTPDQSPSTAITRPGKSKRFMLLDLESSHESTRPAEKVA